MKYKNILRYIFAIPIGVIASIILPKWFMFLFNKFIPLDFITDFIGLYLIKVFAGLVAIGFTVIIAPKKKTIFSILQIILMLISLIYDYNVNGDFNYLFLLGGVIGLFLSNSILKAKSNIEDK